MAAEVSVRHAAVPWLLASVLCSSGARAQEEDGADIGSRAARAGSEPARPAREKLKGALEASPHAAVFGGTFVEGGETGVLLNAGLGAELVLKRHRPRLNIEYQYDPFTTKTFNFPEDDQGTRAARLAQGLHEIDVDAGWQGRWTRWLRSEVVASGDTWLPDNPDDRRWSLRAEMHLRAGSARGPYMEAGAAAFLVKYPRYRVADRRIDQSGTAATVEAGYAWAAFMRVAAGYELELTDYQDARYDRLESNGSVTRASNSKSYVNHVGLVHVAVALTPRLRLRARYEHEFNDSRDYDRRVAASDALGNALVKFLPGYYDYARERGSFEARYAPHRRFSLSARTEGWWRDFSSYEARDRSNVWTGRLRQDTSLELGGEIAVELFDVDAWGLQHGVFLTAFGSHLRRRSNMRREVSLATTFDVTRLFLGLELRPR